jgi:hypothetical protein
MAAMCLKTMGRPRGVAQLALRLVFDEHAARPHLQRHAAGHVFVDVVEGVHVDSPVAARRRGQG